MSAPSTRARMPSDIDAPDKIVYGLSFRQLAILAVAAVAVYGIWSAAHEVVPLPALIGVAVIAGGLAFGLAVGRRDGLPLDQWLLAAVRHQRSPRTLSTLTPQASELPDWVDAPKVRVALPAPLRLPADAIDGDGQIRLANGVAAIVATGSINLGLRTEAEQQAAVDSFGRWLNSLARPTQIVVSAQPVDLASHATQLDARAGSLAHPALRDAAADHAEFLAELASKRDPLRRQILVTTHADPALGAHAAARHADDTARALTSVGVTARALDGAAATAALAAAADPFRPPRPGGQAAPDAVITTPAPRKRKTRT
ncbi:PrgI family protein [Micromonospora sp. DT4]|uniref:PrgI family protein n=1 Tax=Micromonospora sp. DT4 TaxID=3393438 RepID=UPI003CF10985